MSKGVKKGKKEKSKTVNTNKLTNKWGKYLVWGLAILFFVLYLFTLSKYFEELRYNQELLAQRYKSEDTIKSLKEDLKSLEDSNKTDECSLEEVKTAFKNGSVYKIEVVNIVEKTHENIVLITLRHYVGYDEATDSSKYRTCTYDITEDLIDGLSLEQEKPRIYRAVLLDDGVVAYKVSVDSSPFPSTIYTKKVFDDSPPEEVTKYSEIMKGSLIEKSTDSFGVNIDGLYIIGDNGISDTNEFIFWVGLTYGCEENSLKEYCDHMEAISKDLKNKKISGFWVYNAETKKKRLISRSYRLSLIEL